jgi:hypothetical protein
MPRYCIHAGNSTEGHIGYVARVLAESKEEAREKVKNQLPEEVEVEGIRDVDVEHITIHLNPFSSEDLEIEIEE